MGRADRGVGFEQRCELRQCPRCYNDVGVYVGDVGAGRGFSAELARRGEASAFVAEHSSVEAGRDFSRAVGGPAVYHEDLVRVLLLHGLDRALDN